MQELTLITPAPAHKDAALAFRQAFFDAGEPVIHGSGLFDKLDTYEQWLAHLARMAREQTALEAGWVPSSTFFAQRTADGALVGVIDIRHQLNEPLRRLGGHIGYAVHPDERRKGYATRMLGLARGFARTVGLSEVLLGCMAGNAASRRTILANGGVLRETFYSADVNGEVEHYTIALV